MVKPKVFVASSSEGLEVATAIQGHLDPAAEVTIWDQDVFQPSDNLLGSIRLAAQNSDYAIFVTLGNLLTNVYHEPRAVLRKNRRPNLEPIPCGGRSAMQLYVNKENVAALPSRLRYPLARRHARELERMRQEGEQLLAWRVQDIIVGLGLTQADYSMGGGRIMHIPEVLSVTERPVGLDIRMLPGQMPDDFAAHAPAIAYNLGVAEVRVVPLGRPSLIRLILLPGTS